LVTGVLAACDVGFDADCFISTGKDSRTFSAVLFDALREFDKKEVDVVFAQFSLQDEAGIAVKNRLYKSAGNKVIYTDLDI